MSNMRDLLEAMNRFAGERVGQKPGDQVRGSEPMPRKGSKKHPYAGRLVGANESTDNLLKELTQEINQDPVRRDLFQEWHDFKLHEQTARHNSNESEETDGPISEWGAAGTAVGPGNDDADPVEIAAQRAQQVAGKQDVQNQITGLVAQVNGARAELANLNKQFPQGANPVEKAMSMQQMQGQKVALGRQIEDLMSQVAALRTQA